MTISVYGPFWRGEMAAVNGAQKGASINCINQYGLSCLCAYKIKILAGFSGFNHHGHPYIRAYFLHQLARIHHRSQYVSCADLARCHGSDSRSTVRWGHARSCNLRPRAGAAGRSEWFCFEPRARCRGVAKENAGDPGGSDIIDSHSVYTIRFFMMGGLRLIERGGDRISWNEGNSCVQILSIIL